MSSKHVSFGSGGHWSGSLIHTHDGTVCWTDVVHVLQVVDEEGDDGETAKTEPQGKQKDSESNDPSKSSNTIVKDGSHLVSVAVGDDDRVISEGGGLHYRWCSVYHGNSSLLLLLHRWWSLRGWSERQYPKPHTCPTTCTYMHSCTPTPLRLLSYPTPPAT